MEEVNDIAMAYYGTLTEEQKEKVQKCFQSMDKDGDGKITSSEFFDFLKTNDERRRSSYTGLFRDLDKDGNGYLDFTEFITYYYLKIFTTAIRCDGCGVILNGKIYFTCAGCCHKVTSCDLCCSCFSNKKHTHSHDNGSMPVFRDTSSLLLDKIYGEPMRKQRTKEAMEAFGLVADAANRIFDVISTVSGGCATM